MLVFGKTSRSCIIPFQPELLPLDVVAIQRRSQYPHGQVTLAEISKKILYSFVRWPMHPHWHHVQVQYSIRVQLLEIYNEQLRDLLDTSRVPKKLNIQNTERSGLNVPDAIQVSKQLCNDAGGSKHFLCLAQLKQVKVKQAGLKQQAQAVQWNAWAI